MGCPYNYGLLDYGIGYQLAYGPPVMFGQVKDSFINLIADTGLDTFNNILYFLIIITVFLYFAFTLKKESGPLKYGSQFGRYALMIAFGSAYGSITMAYLSLIIGKLEVILKDALHLIS